MFKKFKKGKQLENISESKNSSNSKTGNQKEITISEPKSEEQKEAEKRQRDQLELHAGQHGANFLIDFNNHFKTNLKLGSNATGDDGKEKQVFESKGDDDEQKASTSSHEQLTSYQQTERDLRSTMLSLLKLQEQELQARKEQLAKNLAQHQQKDINLLNAYGVNTEDSGLSIEDGNRLINFFKPLSNYEGPERFKEVFGRRSRSLILKFANLTDINEAFNALPSLARETILKQLDISAIQINGHFDTVKRIEKLHRSRTGRFSFGRTSETEANKDILTYVQALDLFKEVKPLFVKLAYETYKHYTLAASSFDVISQVKSDKGQGKLEASQKIASITPQIKSEAHFQMVMDQMENLTTRFHTMNDFMRYDPMYRANKLAKSPSANLLNDSKMMQKLYENFRYRYTMLRYCQDALVGQEREEWLQKEGLQFLKLAWEMHDTYLKLSPPDLPGLDDAKPLDLASPGTTSRSIQEIKWDMIAKNVGGLEKGRAALRLYCWQIEAFGLKEMLSKADQKEMLVKLTGVPEGDLHQIADLPELTWPIMQHVDRGYSLEKIKWQDPELASKLMQLQPSDEQLRQIYIDFNQALITAKKYPDLPKTLREHIKPDLL